MKKISKYLLLLSIIIIISIFYSFFKEDFTLSNFQKNLHSLQQFVQTHKTLAMIIYMSFYIFSIAVFIPITTLLTLLGGAIFGFVEGTILVSFGSTIGSSFSFLISRYLFRNTFENKARKIVKRVNENINRTGYKYLLFMRLTPIIPYYLVNIVMGLTKIRLSTFYIYSQIGSLPGTAIYVNAGTTLKNINSIKDIATPEVLISFGIIAFAPFLISKLLEKIKHYKLYRSFKKPKQFDFDTVVIGAGSAGLVSSYTLSLLKSDVCLIEEHEMGGDCLNTGCVPSKSLIDIAHKINNLKNIGEYTSIETSENIKVNFTNIMNKIKENIASIEPKDSKERYINEIGVKQILKGRAKILTPYKVQINDKIITTKYIIIASGANPIVPNITGLNQIDYLTSKNLWNLEQLPKNLLILGGGPIGCEMAYAFSSLGSKVTLLQSTQSLIPKNEKEASELMKKKLEENTVKVLLDSELTQIKTSGNQKIAIYTKNQKNHELLFDNILISIGREADINGLWDDKMNIETNKNQISVNPYLQTNYKNIYAVGDCASKFQLTHIAGYEGSIAGQNIALGFIKNKKVDYESVPSIIYTYPEVATVGITEQEAIDNNIKHSILFEKIDNLDRAITSDEKDGFIKVIIDQNKKILGATIVANRAGEMIGEYTFALHHSMGIEDIDNVIHPYPSYLELNKSVIGKYKLSQITPKTHKLLNIVKTIRHLLGH